MRYLESSIGAENVGQVVHHGQSFLDDASQEFWESVEHHAEVLLRSKEFLLLQKDTMQTLFQRDLQAEEKLLYNSAVACAKAECDRNDLPVDGETLRNALEGIVQLVRFPTMTAEEFASGPGCEAILTAEEKVEVFKWHNAAIPQSIFPTEPRHAGQSYVCDRFSNRSTGWYGDGKTHAVHFTVDRAVCVAGYGIYGPYNHGAQYAYTVTTRLSLGAAVLATKIKTDAQPPYTTAEIIEMCFDKPVKLDANKRYTASVTISGIYHYYGTGGCSSNTISTKKGNVVFSFANAPGDTNLTTGQIPQIMFRI